MHTLFRLSVLAAVSLLTACQAVNTTSGGAVGVERKQYMFSMLSAQEVDSMYAQAYQQTLSQAASQGVLDKSSRNAQRVQTIARRLIAQAPVFRADAAQWNWQVNLIDSEELNANCGPGGKIIVYSGLIERLQLTDAELAAVNGQRNRPRSARAQPRGHVQGLTVRRSATQVGAALLGWAMLASRWPIPASNT